MKGAQAATTFDPDCRRCPRLAAFLTQSAQQYPRYHCRPVPSFGEERPRLLVVGLAPGFHGANATGRPFTGDYAGVLLYETLHAYGFASAAVSRSVDDGLQLHQCRITNAVRCVPPKNKPTAAEVGNCNPYLRGELDAVSRSGVVLALGTIAHRAIVAALGLRQRDVVFGHAAGHRLAQGLTLLDSYHCSRYNTQTRRLTGEMFRDVVGHARELVGADS